MTNNDTPARAALDRRRFLIGGGAVAAIVISGRALLHPTEAWGLETKSLQPATLRTMIKLARDVYPHDRLEDKYYALAVKGFDAKAASDAGIRTLIEEGVASLDALAAKAFGMPYAGIGWEDDRVGLLKQVSTGPFFQTVRSGLVVSLYNQKEIWPMFGYEGESAVHGGYIHRGFDDLTWL